MLHKRASTEKPHASFKFLKGCERQMKVKTGKVLTLFLTLALLLTQLPMATSADGTGAVTPQIAYSQGGVPVASGYSAIVVLESDGTLWQLNSDNGNFSGGIAQQVPGPGGTGVFSGVTAVTGNRDGFVALKSDGTVWAWGSNYLKTLGIGEIGNQQYPVRIFKRVTKPYPMHFKWNRFSTEDIAPSFFRIAPCVNIIAIG